ncbi:MAG: MCP four helix bundle domain-containing protein [Sphingobacteriales bacterium]|nr:MAG: MCP four helix bundle domain-containing protein [Sphingobacteriales bacterium]
MKWAYNISQQTKFALFLALVFVVIFVINRMDNSNVEELGTSFSEVYEDRLLVESYIYHISDNLYRKKMAIDNCYNSNNFGRLDTLTVQYNTIIGGYIAAYDKTKLTVLENEIFNQFKAQIIDLNELERQYIHSAATTFSEESSQIKSRLDESFNKILEQLQKLSGIQIAIGKDLNDNSQKIIAGNNILTRFELAILMIIAIVMQIFIFASKTLRSASNQNSQWN